jgi:hypothetical protein
LSAYLESEGWSVWWDKSLGAADLYRDEIMKQLAAARAVITIWTENSIKSDWVRAESGRAKADGKLIPVKTPEVAYADIPLPFGEMHTEDVGSTDLIRAAIVAQLAKPAVTPSPFRQVTGVFKYQVLTWIGIIGSAITLFANLQGVLNLADWAQALVAHWHEWSHMIWTWVFSWVHIKLMKGQAAMLSFATFSLAAIIGGNMQWRRRAQKIGTVTATARRNGLSEFLGGFFLYGLSSWVIGRLIIWGSLLFGGKIEENEEVFPSGIIAAVVPIFYLLYLQPTWPERLWVLIASILFVFVGGCLLIGPLTGEGGFSDVTTGLFATTFLLVIAGLIVLLYSPLRQLTQRLSFIALGVVTLVALNEISKLNLHQYLQPPKVSDSSVR